MPDDILNRKPPPADARIHYGADKNQFGDLRIPKGAGPFPVVVNIHGGYWRAAYDLGSLGELCAALTARGFATWNLEYRRVGDRGGGWPGTLQDIASGFRFLTHLAKEHKLDQSRSVVMGHSAGGQLALCLAGHEPAVENVVSLAGVIDLMRAWELHLSNDAVVELLGGKPSAVPEHYKDADPMQLSIPKAKQWIITGTADDIVPPDISRHYVEYKKKKNEDCHLLEIHGADHFDVIDPQSAAYTKIEKAVSDLLK